MAAFSLDDIRNAAEAKYGSTDITTSAGSVVKMRNPLRMSKVERDALVAIQDELDGQDEDGNDREVDHEEVLGRAITLTAENKEAAAQLLADCNGDLAMLVAIFDMYKDGTQAGEASASAN